MINTVLFDLDNVLVDMSDVHYECLNYALSDNNYRIISRDDHLNKFNGLPTKTKLKMLGVPEDKQKLVWTTKQQYTKKLIKKLLKFDYEKINMHAALIASGFKLGCVTNSIRETAKLMLKTTGQYYYMSTLVSNEDVKHSKPHPQPYIMGMHSIKSKPSQTLIIEDSPIGKESAIKSKASVMMVPNWKHVTFENVVRHINRINNDSQ